MTTPDILDPFVISAGHLDVGDGHQIYYEDWGNPNSKKPILWIHGGPGGSFSDSPKLRFDPKIHRVIFHDQRGGGRSTPYGETHNNTTQHLISDIDKLTEHLGIQMVSLIGGSWGSTLALLYALHRPFRIRRMLLWGIYLARKWETDYVNEGYARYTFPEAWERFISHVPEKDRLSGDSIMKFYSDKIHSENLTEAKKYADEWCLWEYSLMSISYDQKAVEAAVFAEDNIAMARLETQYFLNGCYIPEDFILKNIHKLANVPTYVVQGRFDHCTPAVAAYDLAKAYGDKLKLIWTSAGHSGHDPENDLAIQTVIDTVF